MTLKGTVRLSGVSELIYNAKKKTKENFDVNRRPPVVYPDGLEVVIQDRRNPNGKAGRWNRRGIIKSKRPGLDSYVVQTGGRDLIRSHLYLRPAPASETEVDKETNATRDPVTTGEVLEEFEVESEVAGPRRSNRLFKKPNRLNL